MEKTKSYVNDIHHHHGTKKYFFAIANDLKVDRAMRYPEATVNLSGFRVGENVLEKTLQTFDEHEE